MQDSVLFPAAGHVELGLSAAERLFGPGPVEIENFDILKPMVVVSRPIPIVECIVDAADGTLEVRSRAEAFAETHTPHLRARLTRGTGQTAASADLAAIRAALPDSVDGPAHYADSRRRGLEYGPAFQGIQSVRMTPVGLRPAMALAEISLPSLDDAALLGYRAHPAVLDSCIQVLITLLGRTESPTCAFIPVQIDRVRSLAPLPADVVCQVSVTRETARSGSAEIAVFDPAGTLLLTLSGARFRKIQFQAPASGALVTEGWRVDFAHGTPLPCPLPAPADPATLWRALMLEHPAHSAELILAARHGEKLVATLREELATTDSDKVDAATDQLHDGAPFSALPAGVMAATIQAIAARWPSGRPLRVLELGGGSGGRTASLLKLLPPWIADYVFSDKSQANLDRAKQRFGAQAGFRTALFDNHVQPVPDGFATESFDLIVAGEALDPAQSEALGHARSLLTPGGWLLLAGRPDGRLSTLLSAATAAQPSGLHVVADLDEANDPIVSLQRAGFDCVSPIAAKTLLLAQRAAEPAAGHAAPDAAPRSWMVLAGATDQAFATHVAEGLRRRGQSVRITTLGDTGVPFATPEDLAPVRDAGADAIAHVAGLSNDRPHEPMALQDLRCLSTLSLVQAIKTAQTGYKPQLHLVTHGAFAGPASAGPIDPAQAPLWGLGRVLSNEHPDLAPHLIDLHAELNEAAATALVDELLRSDAEMEVLLTGGQRLVNRMQLTTLTQLATEVAARTGAAPVPFRLDIGGQGGSSGIDSLVLHAVPRTAPLPGQVELRIHAAGLNFRDVLWTMGMLPEEAVEFGFSGATIGMECAGEVVAVGDGVTHVAPGNRVVAFAASTFASHVTTSAGAVSRLPDGIGYAEAATIPTTFLTAYYALEHLARLQPGESVLIHGAAGGVGLAAVQIARLRGAVVFGTAGSDEKRRLLRLMGVDHVLNSRSLDFADDVMRITGGRGVDVVLNSLAGEAITKNLQILRPFGRFLEIGKRDFYANSRIGLRPFRQNLSYFGIDADTLLIERADLAHRVFAEVMALFGAGSLHPLPFTPIPVSRAAEAFRLMQQSRHIGKIVLTIDPSEPAVTSALTLRADATYLVTGGLGGFGLATARWLVEQGARHLALVGRRGATTDEAKQGIAGIEAAGAVARAFAADVTDAADVARLMAEIGATMPPLRGVVHAAAVLDDGPIAKLDGERLHRVMQPKIAGAWNLHQATRDLPLDHFVMYSSGTTVVGNPGQANYVAANLYLDSLAQYRRSLGLPALAIAWGAIKDVGMLARNVGVEEMLQNRTRMGSIPAAEALKDLGRLVAVGATRASVAQFNLQRLGTLLPGTRTPRFLPMATESVVAQLSQTSETLASVLADTPAAERLDVVITRLKDHVGRVLGTGAGQVDTARSLPEMGLDSLMAVELAESLEQDIGAPMSVMQLIQAGSVLAIAQLVLTAIGGNGAEPNKLAAD